MPVAAARVAAPPRAAVRRRAAVARQQTPAHRQTPARRRACPAARGRPIAARHYVTRVPAWAWRVFHLTVVVTTWGSPRPRAPMHSRPCSHARLPPSNLVTPAPMVFVPLFATSAATSVLASIKSAAARYPAPNSNPSTTLDTRRNGRLRWRAGGRDGHCWNTVNDIVNNL